MAEVIPSPAKGNAGRKKLSTRVDLTPMVDLGFLLITFFIFTTSLAQPTAMKLILPDDTPIKDPPKVIDKKALSLIISDDNYVYYYRGLLDGNIQRMSNTPASVRELLSKVTSEVAHEFGDRKETVVLIKPTNKSAYKDLVGILDEMLISDISRYVLVEPAPNEIALIEKGLKH